MKDKAVPFRIFGNLHEGDIHDGGFVEDIIAILKQGYNFVSQPRTKNVHFLLIE